MRRKEAIELSIKKWEYIVGNNGLSTNLIVVFPELGEMKGRCPLCDLYFYGETKKLTTCAKCPLRPKVKKGYNYDESGCCQESHPWNIWDNNRNEVTAYAVLDLIKSIK